MTEPTETLLESLHAFLAKSLGESMRRRTLTRVVVGLSFTAVELDNGASGLCATMLRSPGPLPGCGTGPGASATEGRSRTGPEPGQFAGLPVTRLFEGGILRPSGVPGIHRVVAIATLNALVDMLPQNGHPPGLQSPAENRDAFDLLDLKPRDSVVMVGGFNGYIDRLQARGQPFWILELDPEVIRPDARSLYVPASRAEKVMHQASVAIITGTTLINDSLDGLLAFARPDLRIAVVGPTTPLVPHIFARRGVSVLGGVRVRAVDPLMTVLTEGGGTRFFFDSLVDRVGFRTTPHFELAGA
ncbi:DUF364 domain-containing protein [Phaeovibrio sulfidiphilus]|uniref:DUF364 domain-containing protein n=1 Tax=Phaeovibrio sulfidiphilus TaxID=1220600 RepID=A0A8J6YMU5_9PROT|nr:DUF364 domain-containing protein [Phaeovibrio sulfidiphilus]MBE1237370.1 DUF364 domain-containing protein [Phaeovibrio sulfidiphilus]